ncbi:hypothetical protein GYA49_04265 [Candidatus Beckwithbacteria bacterium]|nr:hypothetical protein [Candidatus Beckwithbacteria bacterium]
MRKLPVFKGYTVDFRLKEFRHIVYGKPMEFIPFGSDKGEKLMNQYIKTPEGLEEYKRNS